MNVVIQVHKQIDGEARAEITNVRITSPRVFVVGRHEGCDLRLESNEVSRQHARVTLGEESFVVEDLSSNGTAISTGDVLRRSRGVFFYGSHLSIGPFRVIVANEGAAGVSQRPHAASPDGRGPRGNPELGVRRPSRSGPVPHAAPPPSPPTGVPAYLPSPPGGVRAHPPSPPAGIRAYPSSPPAGISVYPPVPAPPTPDGGVRRYSGAQDVVQGQRRESGSNDVVQRLPSSGVNEDPTARRGGQNESVRHADPRDVSHGEEVVALRREIDSELLKNLDFAKIDPTRPDPSLRPRVLTALKRIVRDLDSPLVRQLDHDAFIGELLEEALGLGPLEPLLADPSVTEIMVVDPATIYVERNGKLELTRTRFTDEERVRAVIERIVTPLGRRIDESQPLVDARLADGSRVNAIIRPLALRGSCITIRRFPKRRLTVDDFVRLGSLTPRIAQFLERAVVAKKNILISGGTGSGKTTLLNVLSASIPSAERIVTIEDAAELQLHQPHVVSLETKHANMEGKGAFTIRDLVKNALRMRPDRIVVGECRGGEALDMLQAMNTGHDGSLTTIHANSPVEALSRLETLVLMSGVELPSQAIREQIARSIHVIVQQTRLTDGSRKITHVSEIDELDPSGRFEVRPIFEFEQTGVERDGKVIGDFQATGYLPSFLDELLARGLIKPGEAFL